VRALAISQRPSGAASVARGGLLLLLLALPSTAEEPHEAPCELKAGPTRAVVRVIDAETVQLDDASEVRLIGALAPRSPDMSPGAPAWPPEERAEAALRELVLGGSVELAFAEDRRDRYGRLLAHLFLNRDGERVWVQGELLSGGHARAYGLPGSFACMRELLAHERVAREAGAGLWANAAYATRRAFRTRDLLRQRNTYQIVSGRVADVASTKSSTYLNFGKDWRTDFTAGIAAKSVAANPEWAKMLQGLKGQRVEVRGWIEYRNGPFIEVEDASQIAVIDNEGRPSASIPGGPTMSSERSTPSEKQMRPVRKGPGAVDL
jgi:endonuclease YncB( thermonuclease family)